MACFLPTLSSLPQSAAAARIFVEQRRRPRLLPAVAVAQVSELLSLGAGAASYTQTETAAATAAVGAHFCWLLPKKFMIYLREQRTDSESCETGRSCRGAPHIQNGLYAYVCVHFNCVSVCFNKFRVVEHVHSVVAAQTIGNNLSVF